MSLTGLLFDIQRFSLHDGPGIRTTVFLKGCPLRCVWCHNPESQTARLEIGFRPEACALCGACVEACQHNAHHLTHPEAPIPNNESPSPHHQYTRSLCVRCTACVDACLYDALSVAGYERTVEQVMAEVRRDLAYNRKSGGGLTLTGGEPLNQRAFTRALLEAAQAEGIHTCLETCGFAPQKAYAELLPLVDHWLFDYKATDPTIHRQLTGVSNERILANLDFLYQSAIGNQQSAMTLRCPLVPGVNDDDAHLAAIAALKRRYPALAGVEIMPYHNIGNDKYRRFGLPNPLPNLPTADDATLQAWQTTVGLD
jgi:pyruvate formate lyase activating enzyme